MRENLIIYSAKQGANSGRDLQKALDCRFISSETKGIRAIPANTLVVCYGMGHIPTWANGKNVRYLNHPEVVARKISKVWQIDQFRMNDVPTLLLTKDKDNVRQWLRNGHKVLARHDGDKDGEGITVLEGRDVEIPYANFYTRVFPKTHEYRVHVFRGKVIDFVERRRSKYKPEAPDLVRSWANGWIFAHHNIQLTAEQRATLEKAAIGAVEAVGLDFGAADILRYDNTVAVCEVNSCPGLVKDQTIEAYVNAINEVYNNG